MSEKLTLMLPNEYKTMFEAEDTHWWYRSLRAWLKPVLYSYVPPRSCVLDAGCGTGATLSFLRSWGYRSTGIDLSFEALQLASGRESAQGKLCRASVEKLPFCSNIFDGVVNIDVLYLLSNDQEAASLLEFKRVLKPDGILIIHLPAYEWLRSEHDQAVSTQRRYTASMLKSMLATAGFQLIKLEYRYMVFLPALAFVRFAFRRPKANPFTATSDLTIRLGMLDTVLDSIARLEERLGRVVPRPFGTSVCAVARSGKAS